MLHFVPIVAKRTKQGLLNKMIQLLITNRGRSDKEGRIRF